MITIGRSIAAAVFAASQFAMLMGSQPAPTPDPALGQQLIVGADASDLAAATGLLARGADLEARDERLRTPLMAATQHNHIEMARLLIDAGADVNIPDFEGVTPLQHARMRGYWQIAALIEEAGGIWSQMGQ